MAWWVMAVELRLGDVRSGTVGFGEARRSSRGLERRGEM